MSRCLFTNRVIKRLMLIVFTLTIAGAAEAIVPHKISYQGRLTQADSTPVADGVYTVHFNIYHDSLSEVSIWTTARKVNVVGGLFSVILGESVPIPDSVFNGNACYLGISVDSGPEGTPRVPLVTVPYAYYAISTDSARYAANAFHAYAATLADSSSYSFHARTADTADYALASGGGSGGWVDGGNVVSLSTAGDSVGIGTTTPRAKLEVNGGLRATGTINFGTNNQVLGTGALVAGTNDTANGNWATVSGGRNNSSSGDGAAIAGGFNNKASAVASTVIGGELNEASGLYSVAAGYRAKAIYDGSFVWADAAVDSDFVAPDYNTFAIRAKNGFLVEGNNSLFGSLIENNGPGDGLRVLSNVSKGSFWGAIYAHNYGNSPTLSILAGQGKAAFFRGNVDIDGTLSKLAGSFKIDHPLDPANKYLYHSFVESPDMMNIYNGNVVLDADGKATVKLPDYFEALNRDFRYQLTCIGGYAPVYIASEINSNSFEIAGGTPGLKVSWTVTGIRRDAWANAHRIPVEVEKPASERGRYLAPKEHGMPESAAIGRKKDDIPKRMR